MGLRIFYNQKDGRRYQKGQKEQQPLQVQFHFFTFLLEPYSITGV
jgi:hypothetical protein